MSVTEATVQSTLDLNPVENLEGYLAQKDKERATKAAGDTGEAEPVQAEPVAAEAAPAPAATEEPKKVSWREQTLDDIDDAFLKGKPVGELEKSYRASVAAMQKAQREANEAKAELARVHAAAEAVKEPPKETLPNPDNDPEIAEINRLMFEDTDAAVKMLDARTERKSREVAREELQKASQADAGEKFTQAANSASYAAYQRIMADYGWSEAEAAKRLKSTFAVINDYVPEYGPQLWTNPEVYYGAVAELYGKPPQANAEVAAEEPAPTATPVPAIPNPPGGGKPAHVAASTKPQASPLSRELQEARRVVANQIMQNVPGIKFDADEFALGKRKVSNA